MKCRRCNAEKPKSDFYQKSWCKACLISYQCERWKARKKKAVEISGGKCQKCNYSRNLAALDFHHINAEEKEFEPNKAIRLSWDKFLIELKKCVLLCKNCHTELHNPKMDIDLIDSEIAIRSDRLPYKTVQNTGICICGKDVFGTTFCSNKCRAFTQRKVVRPEKAELEQMLKTMSMVAIGKKYGVSDNTIRKWSKLQ